MPNYYSANSMTLYRLYFQFSRVCECSWYGRLAWPPTLGYIRVLPSAISHVFFGCTACDQFVQDGLAGFGAQYAPKTLDILAPGAVSTHDDGYAAIRHIHPFIEYATGDQFGVLPGAEALENRASFLGGSFISNAGQAKAPRARRAWPYALQGRAH